FHPARVLETAANCKRELACRDSFALAKLLDHADGLAHVRTRGLLGHSVRIQPNRDVSVHGDQHRGLASGHDGVLAEDEQFARGTCLDQFEDPVSTAGPPTVSCNRCAPSPACTRRASPKRDSAAATASPSPGREITATFAP